MSNVFHSDPEREQLIKDCEALERQFVEQPALHGSKSKLAAVRSLIKRASAAGLPTTAYVGLQMVVGNAEADAELPEQDRQFKPLP